MTCKVIEFDQKYAYYNFCVCSNQIIFTASTQSLHSVQSSQLKRVSGGWGAQWGKIKVHGTLIQ